jgi:hypothetical protein
MDGVRRTITGSNAAGTMTLGDLRQFVASLEGLPDDAAVKAKTSLRRRLRAITVEEDDHGFRDYIRSVSADAGDAATDTTSKRPKPEKVRDGGRDTRSGKQTTPA